MEKDIKIDYYGELDRYMGIELDHCPNGSVHICRPLLAQKIIGFYLGMCKENSKSTPEFNPPLNINWQYQLRKKIFTALGLASQAASSVTAVFACYLHYLA